MKVLSLVPTKKVDVLPKWKAPANLKLAASNIGEWGKSMHEHAYLVGKTLLWVKKEVGHGNFGQWLEKNVWFTWKTANRMMRFARRCIKSQMIEEYDPGKSKLDIMSNLPSQKKKTLQRPEARLYFDVVKKIDDNFMELTKEDQIDLIDMLEQYLAQLKMRIKEGESND